jgi:hypothetical protein
MNSIIRRFDRAPLEDRLLRANPAQPPKPKGAPRMAGPMGHPGGGSGTPYSQGPPHTGAGHSGAVAGPAAHTANVGSAVQAGPPANASQTTPNPTAEQRPPRRGKRGGKRNGNGGSNSAFAEELAKAL